MLKIIAGQWRGRPLKTPKDTRARPTLGRVREAVFSVLAHDIAGTRAFDLFAGTGALGFEALSRGAESCVFVERDELHVRLIRENAKMLGCEDKADIIKGNLPAILRAEQEEKEPFDLVFMDPPYEAGLIGPVLEALIEYEWLTPTAVLVVESRQGEEFQIPVSLQVLKDKRYGDTQVRFLTFKE